MSSSKGTGSRKRRSSRAVTATWRPFYARTRRTVAAGAPATNAWVRSPPTSGAMGRIRRILGAGIVAWTEADLRRMLREGRKPSGTMIDPFMPWETYAKMTDEEIAAIWLYLRSVPAKPFGNKWYNRLQYAYNTRARSDAP